MARSVFRRAGRRIVAVQALGVVEGIRARQGQALQQGGVLQEEVEAPAVAVALGRIDAVAQQRKSRIALVVRLQANHRPVGAVLQAQDGVVREALPQALAGGEEIVLRGLAVAARHQGCLEAVVRHVAQRRARHHHPLVAAAQVLLARGKVEEQAARDADLRVEVRREQVVRQVVAGRAVALLAAADVILHARRELQRAGERLAELRLEVHLVPEIMIMVPRDQRVIDVADHRGICRTGEEGVAAAEAGIQRHVAVGVVLRHRQAAVVELLAHAGQVIAGIGLQDRVGRELQLVLPFPAELVVRTRPGAAVRKDGVVESHVDIVHVEGKAAAVEGLGAAHVPVHERGADAQLVARGHVGGLHRQHGGQRLAVLAAVAAQREAHSLEEEGREAPALVLTLDVRAVRDQDVHPVDEGLALLALAAADVELAVLADLLRTGQDLQGRDEVPAGVARHHHVQRIQLLELVALAHAERAGGHHHLVDGGRFLAQADVQLAEPGQVRGHIEVFIAEEDRAHRPFTRFTRRKGEAPQRVGDPAVKRTDHENVDPDERAVFVGNFPPDGGLGEGAGRQEQRRDESCQQVFHAAKMGTGMHSCNFWG